MNARFVIRVLESTGQTFWQLPVLVPSALAVIGTRVAFAALDADRGFWNVPMGTMWLMVLVALGRFWIGLSVTATALSSIRRRGQSGFVLVPPTTAFEAGVVSLAVALPALACLLFVIVPGVILALRWSQVLPIVLDGRAHWLEAADESAELTWGRRIDILLVWAILAAIYLGMAGVAPILPAALDWALRCGASAFSLTAVAAVYVQLDQE